jgi:hypothetical protein
MDASVLTPVATGVAGIVVASSIALVKGAIASRSKESEELREWRLKAYPDVWKLTSIVPRWPRGDPTYGDLRSVHFAFRDWYYTSGGLYLSEHARARYGDMQELFDAYLERKRPDDETPILQSSSGRFWDHSPYKALMESCSTFRTALTEDLATRRSRSILWAIGFWWRHRQEGRTAARRLAAAKHRHAVDETGAPAGAALTGGASR